MDILDILIAEDCGVFDDLEKEENKDETIQKTN